MIISIEIQDENADEIMNAFASGYNAGEEVDKQEFMTSKINEFIKNVYTEAKVQESRKVETQVKADAEVTMSAVSVSMTPIKEDKLSI